MMVVIHHHWCVVGWLRPTEVLVDIRAARFAIDRVRRRGVFKAVPTSGEYSGLGVGIWAATDSRHRASRSRGRAASAGRSPARSFCSPGSARQVVQFDSPVLVALDQLEIPLADRSARLARPGCCSADNARKGVAPQRPGPSQERDQALAVDRSGRASAATPAISRIVGIEVLPADRHLADGPGPGHAGPRRRSAARGCPLRRDSPCPPATGLLDVAGVLGPSLTDRPPLSEVKIDDRAVGDPELAPASAGAGPTPSSRLWIMAA